MNHPKNLLAICLLISCANTTNTVGHSTDDGGNKVEHKMVDIFDNAIGQFVEKFATKPESTSSSNDHNQQQQMQLTYRDVVHILKQIEEKVAQRITNAERKGYMFIMRDFHGLLGRIYKDISHREIQWRREQISSQNHLESLPMEKRDKAETELLHRLLTFAIRMGFHIGHTALNAGMRKTSQIDLHEFVRAQSDLEKIYKEHINASGFVNAISEHRIVFENVPTARLIKLKFTPSESVGHQWNINGNLTTIRWLLLHSAELTSEEWVHLVAKIQTIQMDSLWARGGSYLGTFFGYRPCSLEGTNKAELLLNQLILGWEGSTLKKVATSYLPDRVVFCALHKFGTILVKSLNGVKKFKITLPNMRKLAKHLCKIRRA